MSDTYVCMYVRMYVLYVVVPFNEGVHSELGQSTYVCTVVVPFNEGVHSELGQSSREMQIKFMI